LENGLKEGMMKGKKYSAEQIVAKLREAEVLLGKGMALGEVCRQLDITDVTYYVQNGECQVKSKPLFCIYEQGKRLNGPVLPGIVCVGRMAF
jgi:hypothetical protein